MNFLIADTFQSSLGRLSGAEQKAAKTAAFDLQLDPAGKGKSFHRLDRVRDPNFWSVRVNDDLRLIVHRAKGSLLLAYVGHHDDAYAWAARRRFDTHPTTGAAQIVEVREAVVNEGVTNKSPIISTVPFCPPSPPILTGVTRDDLLTHGVPPDWLDDVLAATEDTLLDIAAHLPAEAAEAVLAFATGTRPEPPAPEPATPDPFAHPDALRRFRVLDSRAALERALDYPWERWTVFLHPAQARLVDRPFNGPARVAGLPHIAITGDADAPTGRAVRATMHIAKGMEFRAVAVMACDEGLLPLASRMEAVADESDLDEVYTTERHLQYVACTRARDHLLVTGVDPASEFLDDLQGCPCRRGPVRVPGDNEHRAEGGRHAH